MGYHSSNFKSRWGYGFVVLAALLWASGGTASKFLFNNGLSPFQLVQLRVTICGVVLFAVLGIRRPSLLRISRGDILYFAILGIFGMAAVQFFYLFAISKINVAAAILLEYLAPVFIALHTLVFTREKLNGYVIAAIAGAVVGCYLVVGAYNLEILTMNLAGIVSGILSGVTFAWYSIHGEYGMRKYNPWMNLKRTAKSQMVKMRFLFPFFIVLFSAEMAIRKLREIGSRSQQMNR